VGVHESPQALDRAIRKIRAMRRGKVKSTSRKSPGKCIRRFGAAYRSIGNAAAAAYLE
jgi:hypothetical protein